MGLLSKAIEVFRQAELQDEEASQLLVMQEELASQSDNDIDDDNTSSESDEI